MPTTWPDSDGGRGARRLVWPPPSGPFVGASAISAIAIPPTPVPRSCPTARPESSGPAGLDIAGGFDLAGDGVREVRHQHPRLAHAGTTRRHEQDALGLGAVDPTVGRAAGRPAEPGPQ